jgi:protein TonB
MTPVLKDILEVANPAGESAPPQDVARAKTGSDHLNSDAVSLDVPVMVHGSRVTDVVRGITPHSEAFEEQTTTMIVFPQGGVLKMSTVVSVGQVLVLANLKSRQDAICRVVKVRTYSNSAGYVEVEFTHPQPGYWGVYFPSDGPELAKKVVPLAPRLTRPAEVSERPLPGLSSSPPTVPELAATKATDTDPLSSQLSAPGSQPVQISLPCKQGSSFISIGSQEDVQAAASTTSFTRVVSTTKTETKGPASVNSDSSPEIDFPPAPPAASPLAPSLAQLHAHAEAVPVAANAPEKQEVPSSPDTSESPAKDVPNTFGTLSGGSSLGGRRLRAGLQAGMEFQAEQHAKPRKQGKRLAAIAVLIVCLLGGGIFFFFGYHSASHGTATSAFGPAKEPARTTPPQQFASQGTQTITVSSPVAELKPASESAIIPSAKATRVSKEGTASVVKPSPPVRQPAANVTSDLFRTLNAHPVSSRREDALPADSAPILDARTVSSSGDSALASIASLPGVAPPPPLESSPNPHKPLSIGAQIKEPRLLSSPMPVYPMVAKQTHIEGDVVINTLIDQSGKVTNMKVVSGPPILRQAAVDALRKWKYEPSQLDGQSVAVQLLVTLKFRFASQAPTR